MPLNVGGIMLADLWDRYDHTMLDGDNNPDKLYELVQPYLANLYDDTIIYHERHIYVAKLSEIKLDSESFGAKATRIGVLKQLPTRVLDQWRFNCTWKWYHVSGSWLAASPYVGYRVMVDPDLVAQIVWCMKKDDIAQAQKLFSEREILGRQKSDASMSRGSEVL